MRKQIRRDRRAQVLEETSHTLDVKDRWLGLKRLRSEYVPKVYEKADMHGTPHPPSEHAQITAEYLRDRQWGDHIGPSGDNTNHRYKGLTYRKLNRYHPDYNIFEITLDEIKLFIKKAKKR